MTVIPLLRCAQISPADRFDRARQEMLAALRELPDGLLVVEAFATCEALRQAVELGR